MWSNPSVITALIIAVTGLVGAIAGLVGTVKAHRVINVEVRPGVRKNARDIVQVRQEIDDIKNGNNM